MAKAELFKALRVSRASVTAAAAAIAAESQMIIVEFDFLAAEANGFAMSEIMDKTQIKLFSINAGVATQRGITTGATALDDLKRWGGSQISFPALVAGTYHFVAEVSLSNDIRSTDLRKVISASAVSSAYVPFIVVVT